MANDVLTRDGPVAVPLDYNVPQSGELLPLTVRAVLDGSGAASEFFAVVQVIAPSGRVMANGVSASIAAGGSADCTWFPGVDVDEPAATTDVGVGVTVETLFLDLTVGTVTASTVFAAGVEYTFTVQGTFIYYDHALNVGNPEPAAMFPTSSAGRTSTQVGLDSETVFARASTAAGPGIGHYTLFKVDLGSGAQHIEPTGGPYSSPQAGHFYTYTVTGQGVAPTFSFADTVYSDNYGKLRIAIQTLEATGTPGSGGTGTGSFMPDPASEPDGSWLRTTGGAAVWDASPDLGVTDVTSSGGSITVGSPTGPTTNVDVATSGVAAGTYGDAGNVPQFAVGSDGRVTGVSNVPIGGGVVTSADGWIADSTETWTYASFAAGPPAVGTFTVPGDLRTKYSVGTRVKLTQTTVKYFVVSADPTYDGTNTTVTITGGTDYTLANAAITANYHSYVLNPQGYPGWFNFAMTLTGFTGTPTVNYAVFSVAGRLCTLVFTFTGTSNSNACTCTSAPIPCAATTSVSGVGAATNAGTVQSTPARVSAGGGSSTLSFGPTWANFTGWTGSGIKAVSNACISYEI